MVTCSPLHATYAPLAPCIALVGVGLLWADQLMQVTAEAQTKDG